MQMESNKIRKGKYTFTVFQFQRPSIRNTVDVEILKETERSYLIKLKGFTANRTPNEEIWVSKKFVKVLASEDNDLSKESVVKEYWWNKD